MTDIVLRLRIKDRHARWLCLWDSYGLNYGFADDMRLVIQVEAVKQ